MHIAIIGNGVAGITAARHVRKLDPDVRISVVSDESDHFYSRTALMYIYMGHMTYAHTKPYQDHFWPRNRIALVRDRVEHIDVASRELILRDGTPLAYDRLLIATGSTTRSAGWDGEDLTGVQGLYGLQDLAEMERRTQGIRRAVVVGGGLIGIELAEMLHARGIHVTLLVREARFYGTVMPDEEAGMIEREIRRHGIDLRLEVSIAEFLGDAAGRVRAVRCASGEEIPAEFVGVAIGVVPNAKLARLAGIETDLGVLVDEHFATSAPDVFAAGDCAQLRRPVPGLTPVTPIWYVARQQGAVAAFNLCDRPRAFEYGVFFNSAKFFTIEWQTYGQILPVPAEGVETLYWEHPDGRRAVRIAYATDDGAVLGFNLMGVRFRQDVCERWITQGAPLAAVLDDLRAASFDAEFSDRLEGAIRSAAPLAAAS